MRVAKRYVDELLSSTDALEAVSRLSQFWAPRARIEMPRFGLSQTEYNCQLCLIFFGEVGNGGLSQYFLNRGVSFAVDTSRALGIIGFAEASRILDEAAKLLGPDFDPDSSEIPEWRWSEICSKESHIGLSDVDGKLLAYLRTNRSDVLQPEIAQGH